MKPLNSTYPQTHILNPKFKYVPAEKTDIRETFKQVNPPLSLPEKNGCGATK